MKPIIVVIALFATSLVYSQTKYTKYEFPIDYTFYGEDCNVHLKCLHISEQHIVLEANLVCKINNDWLMLPISPESYITIGGAKCNCIGYKDGINAKIVDVRNIPDFPYIVYVDNVPIKVGRWGVFDAVAYRNAGKVIAVYVVYENNLANLNVLPCGADNFSLYDIPELANEVKVPFKPKKYMPKKTCSFVNCKLSNVCPDPCKNIGLAENEIKAKIDAENDGITGIYEGMNNPDYKLACIKDGDGYALIFLGFSVNLAWWNVGDVKANLFPTATRGLYRADWITYMKHQNKNVFVAFDGMMMSVSVEGRDFGLVKMYPVAKR